MTQQPVQVSYRFDYFADKDVIQFSIKLGELPALIIVLPTEAFFSLCDGIVTLGEPFLNGVRKKRAEGVKEDIKVEFDAAKWNDMMGWDKKEGGKADV